MGRGWLVLPALAALALQACTPAPRAEPAASLSGTGFSGRVLPTFRSWCVDCHRGPDAPRQLELDSYEHVMRGSTNGPVVVPGDADRSVLVEMVRFGFMPMGKPRLPEAQVQAIIDWIAAGAPAD